jgi:hypothetical protein
MRMSLQYILYELIKGDVFYFMPWSDYIAIFTYCYFALVGSDITFEQTFTVINVLVQDSHPW